MPDPIQMMLAAGVIPSRTLPASSRYSDVGTATRGVPPGAGTYFRRRLVPEPERAELMYEIQVRQGDRHDSLAYAHLGDAFLWWRLADANPVLDPADLTAEPGRWLRITLPPDTRQQAGATGAEGAAAPGTVIDDA